MPMKRLPACVLAAGLMLAAGAATAQTVGPGGESATPSSEVALSWRARLILAQDRPTLTGYDQVAWAMLARPDFAALLDAFEAMRGPNLLMLRAVKDEDWQRVGLHTERGEVSLRLLVETSAGHDRAHLRQIEQTLAAVR